VALPGSLVLFGGLGLVGSPPFNVFLSEFIILWAAFDRFRQAKAGLAAPSGAVSPYFLPAAIYAVAIVVFLLTVTLIFAGLVGHVSRLLLGNSGSGKLSESLADLLPLLLLAAVIVAFGLFIPNTPINFSTLLGHSVCLLQNGVGAVCLP
jgi:formate hydrogenlyase subunit 3/multisubunit Na+/H+ antiporter MnhD subunit